MQVARAAPVCGLRTMARLVICCWKWRGPPGYRSTFTAEHVNVLRSMVARHYRKPHEFVCITDDPAGIDADVRIVPLWSDYADIPNPTSSRNPSCYRRLKMFSEEAADLIGPRIASLDLDCVIRDDLAPILERPEDFVMWGDTARSTPYNGSLILLTAGARRQVWDRFDPRSSPREGLQRGYIGSDQAWIACALGPHEARFTPSDGVYSYINEVRRQGGRLPPDARIVFFHGKFDPWQPDIQRAHAWVRDNWR